MIPVYRHRLPVSGLLEGEAEETFKTYLENILATGIYGLGMSGNIYSNMELEKDAGGISAIDIYTYHEKFGVSGRCIKVKGLDAKDVDGFVEKSVDYALKFANAPGSISVAGPIEHMGMTEPVPDVLYHIADRKNLGSIMEDGLVPQKGVHNAKNGMDCVCFADVDNMDAWLTLLQWEDPVLLEVDTKDIKKLKPGRVWDDLYGRGLPYGEWRTSARVPSLAIREADLSEEQCQTVLGRMTAYAEHMDHRVMKRAAMDIDAFKFNFHSSVLEECELVWGGMKNCFEMGIAAGAGVEEPDFVKYCRDDLGLKFLTAVCDDTKGLSTSDIYDRLQSVRGQDDDFADAVNMIPGDAPSR